MKLYLLEARSGDIYDAAFHTIGIFSSLGEIEKLKPIILQNVQKWKDEPEPEEDVMDSNWSLYSLWQDRQNISDNFEFLEPKEYFLDIPDILFNQ